MWKTRIAAALVLVASAAALADIDVAVRNGDTITSSVAAGGDVAVFRASVPGGSTLNIGAKAAKNGIPFDVRVVQGDATELAHSTGTSVTLASVDVTASGEMRVEVKALDGASAGAFTLSVSWIFRDTTFTDTSSHAANTLFAVPFTAAAGAEATFTTGPADGASTKPSLNAVLDRSLANSLPVLSGTDATRTIPSTGEWLLFVNTGAKSGSVTTTVHLDYPDARARKMRVAASDTPTGVTARIAAPFKKTAAGRLDGIGPVAGASVVVAKGALKRPGTLFLGEPDVGIALPDLGLTVAGPPVYVGFVGASVAARRSVTVNVPVTSGAAVVRVYRRDADGTVSRVPLLGVTDGVASAATDRGGTFVAVDASALTGETSTLSSGESRASEFGRSLAADATTLLVGTSLHSPSEGAVRVYAKVDGAWSFSQSLTAGDGGTDDDFGRSVALYGDTAVVGAPGSFSTPGAAYIFTRRSGVWTQTAKLSSDNDGFGWSVAIDHSTIVVGAPAGDHADVYTGASASWTRTDVLRGPGNSMFGYSVAVEGKTAVVGAWREGDGAAHVYAKSSGHWRQVAKLADEPGLFDDQSLGFSVAIEGDVIAAGAAYHQRNAPGDGAVNLYRLRPSGKWALSQRLAPSDDEQFQGFGGALALRDSRLFVAAYDQVGTTPAPVFAYRVGATVASLVDRRVASQFTPGFGRSLALAGETLVVAAPSGSDDPLYLFDVAGL